MKKVYAGVLLILALATLCAGQNRGAEVTLTSGTRIIAELQVETGATFDLRVAN